MKLSKNVIIGLVAVLLILIIIVLFLSSRSKQSQPQDGTTPSTESPSETMENTPKSGGLVEQIKKKLGGGSSQVTPTIAAELLEQKGAVKYAGETITYGNGFKGYYSAPVKDGIFPGVVMIHEWWGLNDHMKTMADLLASHGYRVVAVDLYNGGVATTPDDARSYVSSLDSAKAIENMRAAKAYLKSKGAVKVGSLGWCFGGSQSLQFALNEPLDATVLYYGTPVTDGVQLSKIKSPVLGIFGDKDEQIPVAKVNEFTAALLSAGVVNEVKIYPGVGHAFANPSGQNYAPEQTKDAWKKTLGFLTTHLR